MQFSESRVLESIKNYIEELPSGSKIPLNIYAFLQQNFVKVGVDLSLKNNVVHCDKYKLDLSKKKKLVKIFEVFLSRGKGSISIITLIRQIYDESFDEKSLRQKNCYSHNVVKLISRARKLLKKTLSDDVRFDQLHWFPYDPSSKTWRLYVTQDEPYSHV